MRATIFLCTLVVSSTFSPSPVSDKSAMGIAAVIFLLLLLDLIELSTKDRKDDRKTNTE